MSSGCELGLTALKLCNSETCIRWGMFSGRYLPLCDQSRKKIWGETSKAQKLWGEFCFVSMWSLQLPFEMEGNATRKARSALTLVWSLPEASTVLRPGIQGWRGCGLGPWWPLFFRYLLNFCDVPDTALRRLGWSICTDPPSWVHSVGVILCWCFS